MEITLHPVATVKNTRQDLSDDYWGGIISEIELVNTVPETAFDGIDSFSHLEIIFYFNRARAEEIVFSGHPRGNTNWPHVGIFAQRKKDRPNAIGLTIAELVKREGNTIWVKNLDAVNGTPILDIKPVLKEFLPSGQIKQPQWCSELMKDYWAH